jgi:hypothetical protein
VVMGAIRRPDIRLFYGMTKVKKLIEEIPKIPKLDNV